MNDETRYTLPSNDPTEYPVGHVLFVGKGRWQVIAIDMEESTVTYRVLERTNPLYEIKPS